MKSSEDLALERQVCGLISMMGLRVGLQRLAKIDPPGQATNAER
jgi:hypothetical protein